MKLKLEARGEELLAIPHNHTNEDVLATIRAEYPDLRGPLAVMADRFEKLLDKSSNLSTSDFPIAVNCPSCGSQLDIVLED